MMFFFYISLDEVSYLHLVRRQNKSRQKFIQNGKVRQNVIMSFMESILFYKSSENIIQQGMAQPIYTILRIVTFGQSGSGKTSLVQREIQDKYVQNMIMNIGIDFKIKIYQVNDVNVKAQIWDYSQRSGQRFKAISPSYYRNAHAFVLCFNLSAKMQIQELQARIKTARSINQQGKIFLIGCKGDCGTQTPEDFIKKFADNHGIQYFRTSSKQNIGVHEAFQQIIHSALITKQNGQLNKINVQISNRPVKNKKDCQIMQYLSFQADQN